MAAGFRDFSKDHHAHVAVNVSNVDGVASHVDDLAMNLVKVANSSVSNGVMVNCVTISKHRDDSITITSISS